MPDEHAGAAPVVEYLVRARTTWGTRLYADGRAEEWTDAAEWRRLARIPASDVTAFLDYVRASGYLDLPEVLAAGDAIDDGSQVSWSIDVDGTRHDVTARAAGPSLDPVLRGLNDELQAMVGRALAREADAPGDGVPED